MPAIEYENAIEQAVAAIAGLLTYPYRFTTRAVALLLLQGDAEMERLINLHEPQNRERISELVRSMQSEYRDTLHYVITMCRRRTANQILSQAVAQQGQKERWNEYLSYLTMWPVTGIPILGVVLYVGIYQFVGQFGAGWIVDYLENIIFKDYINYFVNGMLDKFVPFEAVRTLMGGEYGIVTLGFRYALAIVLPVVGTFFIAFSVMEDSGYLPRLAMLLDGVFKAIGLSGRAVIPLVLGLGCGTMATMVTRTLETWRERLIATFLLALAIPCSAQLGLIMGMLSANPRAMFIWSGLMCATFLLSGFLADRFLPGQRPAFYMELPPLRLPKVTNVLIKTYMRMHWYVLEILPLFVAASVLIWLGKLTGGFDWLMKGLAPLTVALGLPEEAAKIFVYGFFRRDYGAAGLYDMIYTGSLTTEQLLVSATVLTLFIPCIAQFAVLLRERGWRISAGIVLFVFPFAFAVGYVLHHALLMFQIGF